MKKSELRQLIREVVIETYGEDPMADFWEKHPTPKEDVDRMLAVEKSVKPEEMPLYLDCLNGRPLSQRKTASDIRAGCILTGVFMSCRKNS